MTRRTLVLGTSHLGAIYSAWKARDPRPEGLDFFAWPAYAHDRVGRLPDGRFGLLEDASLPGRMTQQLLEMNGSLVRDPADYDRVVFVGQTLYRAHITGLIVDHGLHGIRKPQGAGLMSRAAFRAFTKALVKAELAKTYRAIFPESRFAVIPTPLRAKPPQQEEKKGSSLWPRSLRDIQGAKPMLLLSIEAMAEALRAEGMDLLAQPPETISEEGYTEDRFAQSGLNLYLDDGNGQPSAGRADYVHMNAEFGDLMLTRILDWAA